MSADIWEDIGSWTNFDSTWLQFGGIFFAIALLLYCIYHAGSTFFLLDRVWILVGGNKEFSDTELNKDWNNVRDLELFRYRYRLPVDKLEQINEISKWRNNYDISLIELRQVSFFYDMGTYKLKRINFERTKKWLLGLICILLFSIGVAIYFSINNDHRFVIVKTDQAFKFDGKRVKIDDEVYEKDYCESFNPSYQPQADKNKAEYNVYTACELFGDEGRRFYRKSLKAKFITGMTFIIIFGYLLIYASFHLRRCERLDTLTKKINTMDNAKNNQKVPLLTN